jgi:CheY-like chemotaxis protein
VLTEVSKLETADSEQRVLKILYVDDDPYMQRLMQLYLCDEAITLEFAGNGRIALFKLQKSIFDLVISDLQMPEMDGICLIREIRKRQITLPVVVLSAFGMESMVTDALSAGADKILQKPFDAITLISAINDFVPLNRC